MTVLSQTSKNISVANGVTTVFPYQFKIVAAADLLVLVDGVAQTLNVDYTLTGVGLDAGGNVTFATAPANLALVVRKRNMAYARATDFQNQGDLLSATMNNDQDAPVLMVQQLAEQIGNALKVPDASPTISAELPAPTPLAPLVWNAAGDAIANGDPNVTGDMLLRGELASTTDPAKGSALVQFKRSGVAQALAISLATLNGGMWNLLEAFTEAERAAITSYTATADFGARINAFLAAANDQGVNVYVPPGLYPHSVPIQFGNPPASNPSAINGIRFIGAGVGRNADTMNADEAPTRFQYIGTAGGTCMKIAGPISGVHLEGFMVDGNGLAATILDSQRSFHQTVREVTGVNWTNGFGLVINADTALGPTYGGAAPIDHLYEQFNLKHPGAGASALDIASGTGNVNQLLFLRCYLDRYNTTSTIGLRLGYCDHINFVGCHLAQTGAPGSTGIAIQVRPQPGFGGFPTNITFTGTAMAGGVAYDSSLQAWTNAVFPALIFQPFYAADGAPVPPKSANGGADLPAGMARGWTDTGIEFGWWGEDQESVTAAATIAPKKKVVLLSGNATVTTITPPRSIGGVVPIGGYRITLIPQITGGNAISLGTGGNIAEATSLSNLRAIELVYSEGTGVWSILSDGPPPGGVYTPTLTGITNYSTGTAREFKFSRVGNTVNFAGRIEATPTTTGQVVVEFTLPITPATFTQSWDCAGTAVNAEATYTPGLVIGQTVSARVQFQATTTASRGVIIQGSYKMA